MIRSNLISFYIAFFFNFISFGQDSISITSPGSGDVYAGDDLTVSYSYASSGGGYSSPRWAYSTSSYGWQSAVESYSTRVGGSQWLNHVFDGYDSTRTLYVRLLDQGNGSVLASNQRTFTYRSGSSINVSAPSSSTVGAGDALSVSFSYASSVGSYSTPRWAYKIGSNYNISSTGTEVNAVSVPGSQWLNGFSHGQSSTVYLALLHPSTGEELAYASKYFNLSTFDGSSISITSPGSGDVYAGDDLTVSYSYASSGGGYSSPRWAYSTSSYGWQSAVESYSTRVGGSQWLNHVFDGYDSTRTLYVRLLDQGNGSVLASNQRTFTYRSGSSINVSAPSSSTVGAGDALSVSFSYASSVGSYSTPRWAYKIGSNYNISSTGTEVNAVSVPGSQWLNGFSHGQSSTVYLALLHPSTGEELAYASKYFNLSTFDGSSISITSPGSGDVYAGDDLTVSYSYASSGGGYSSPRWAYSTSSYGWQSAVESYSTRVGGSQWLNHVFDGYDSTRTLYVRLLDQGNGSVLASNQRTFTYRSGSNPNQSNGSGYQSGGSGYQSPDSISITFPNTGTLYSNNSNGLQVQWNYQSQSNTMQSLSWAYKLDGGSYSSPVTGTDSVSGSSWLNGTSSGNHTLYVALLDQGTGNQLTTDSHSFNYQTGDGGTQSGTGGTDSISITSPGSGDVYAGDDLTVSYSYASSGGGYSSPRWAYSTSSYGWQSAVESYSTRVGGSQWLNHVFDGYDSTRTLYVRLLDQGNGSVLASNQRTFTYRSGSSINVSAPSSSTVGAGDALSVSFSYASSVGSYSTPRWAYKIGSNYNISSTGTEVNAVSVPGSQWLNGFSHGQSSTVYLALLHPSTGEELAYASKYFNLSTFDGSSISITSPGSGDVYAGDDLTVSYSYASSGGGYSSPRWAYSTSSYGWQSAVESYSTRVGGSQWLNHVFDGYDSTRTLYVRLLDQGNGSVLASNQRTFTYRSGSSINVSAPSSSTVGAGDALSVSFSYASSVGSYSTPRWAYKIGSNYNISSTGTEVNAVSVPGSQWLNGFSHGQSSTVYLALLHPSTGEELAYASKYFNLSTFDGSSISITSPGSGDVYAGDDLTVSYSYASSGGGYSSPRWAYSTSSYGWQSAVESYSTRVGGSQWLNHVFDGYDSTRTLYVRLLDQGNGSVLASNQRTFTYRSGSNPNQSNGSGYQSGGSGYQSPDSISITFPNTGTLYSNNSNGLQVQWNYQSQSNTMQSLSWAYKLDGGSYSSPVTGTDSVSGSSWLNGTSSGNHTLYVALLDQGTGNQLTTDSHSFNYQSESGYQTPTSSYQSPDSISISSPNTGMLYDHISNELSIDWNYQSQSNDKQSLRWSYKIDGGNYSSPISGTERISGLSWLNGVGFGSHTLHVALLNITGSEVLAYDNVDFIYTFNDYDSDGIRDSEDIDDDNDNFTDSIELLYGFNPKDKNDHPLKPLVSSVDYKILSNGSYLLNGKILNNGGLPITQFGIQLQNSGLSLLEDYSISNLAQDGYFSLEIGSLEKGETYYFQAYASNLAGTGLGSKSKFTVSGIELWWSEATVIAEGWRTSWLGKFMPFDSGWIYHLDFGWVYVEESDARGLWLWMESEGWIWSSENAWPFLWSNKSGDWIYFTTSNNKNFLFDYSTGKFSELSF